MPKKRTRRSSATACQSGSEKPADQPTKVASRKTTPTGNGRSSKRKAVKRKTVKRESVNDKAKREKRARVSAIVMGEPQPAATGETINVLMPTLKVQGPFLPKLGGMKGDVDRYRKELDRLGIRDPKEDVSEWRRIAISAGIADPVGVRVGKIMEAVRQKHRDIEIEEAAKHRIRMRLSTSNHDPSGGKSDARHSPDFCSVDWFGTPYKFSTAQAACIKVLWESWANGTPVVSQAHILCESDVVSTRLSDVFKNHPAWKTLVVLAGKGLYRLKQPVE